MALGLAVSGATTAQAGLLNPVDFQSLGSFIPGNGTYSINTSGDAPTLTGPGVNFTGVDDPNSGAAVFDFNTIVIGSSVIVNATGLRPLALLSRGNLNVAGQINVSADGQTAGPGGGDGGTTRASGGGIGGGGPGTVTSIPPFSSIASGGAGGGGFGGAGANGNSITYFGQTAAGGRGGIQYGDLQLHLQGGSGGGGGGIGSCQPHSGGGGGGAIELGAVFNVGVVRGGSINANGGDASVSSDENGGGGSGGGILIHAPVVSLGTTTAPGILSAVGGLGANSDASRGFAFGGGGGGGRVEILTGQFQPEMFDHDLLPTVDVSGGGTNISDAIAGFPGAKMVSFVSFTPVPELDPGSLGGALTLLSGGLMTMMGRRRRK